MDDLELIRAAMPVNDGCPVLQRLAGPVSESASASTSRPGGAVRLRVKDWTGTGSSPTKNPIWELDGDSPDPARGLLHARLVRSITERPGIETYTTRTFPYLGAWLAAIAGRHNLDAATNYRRHLLRAQAGGLSIPDKDKEREYLVEGLRLGAAYTDLLRT